MRLAVLAAGRPRRNPGERLRVQVAEGAGPCCQPAPGAHNPHHGEALAPILFPTHPYLCSSLEASRSIIYFVSGWLLLLCLMLVSQSVSCFGGLFFIWQLHSLFMWLSFYVVLLSFTKRVKFYLTLKDFCIDFTLPFEVVTSEEENHWSFIIFQIFILSYLNPVTLKLLSYKDIFFFFEKLLLEEDTRYQK